MLTVCQLSSSFGRLPESTRFGLNRNASTSTLAGACSVLQTSLIRKSAGTNHAQCVNTYLNKLECHLEALIPDSLQNHKMHLDNANRAVSKFYPKFLVSSTSSQPKIKMTRKAQNGWQVELL
jgi:hypothetical protein